MKLIYIILKRAETFSCYVFFTLTSPDIMLKYSHEVKLPIITDRTKPTLHLSS